MKKINTLRTNHLLHSRRFLSLIFFCFLVHFNVNAGSINLPLSGIDPPTASSVSITAGDAAPTLTAACNDPDCTPCAFDPNTMNVSVSFSGNHTFISDLAFYLQAPDGTIVTLIDGVCCPNAADDYDNVTFTNNPAGGDLDYSSPPPAPLSGIYNSSNGTLIDWSPFAGQNIFSTGWNVIVGDCVGGDSGDLDRAILTFVDDGGGASCIAGQPPVIYDSGATDLNEPLNDGECEFGIDNPAVFAVNIPDEISRTELLP